MSGKNLNMVIELDYSDEELTELISALNNAIVALDKIYGAAKFGCGVPAEFDPLFKNKSFQEIDSFTEHRLGLLKNLYSKLIEYENLIF